MTNLEIQVESVPMRRVGDNVLYQIDHPDVKVLVHGFSFDVVEESIKFLIQYATNRDLTEEETVSINEFVYTDLIAGL